MDIKIWMNTLDLEATLVLFSKEAVLSKNIPYSKSGDQDILANYIEISIDPSLLNNFANEDGMETFLKTQERSEEFLALKNELIAEIMLIIKTSLTEKQKEVVLLTYVDGKTQNEISEELGKHQTTVHKLLRGNIDYKNNKKRYGGALKKIKKICRDHDKVQDILSRMREVISSS